MARSRQSTPEQRVAFGLALKEAAEGAGVGTTTGFAAYLTAHGHPITQTTVGAWFRGAEGEPSRPTVMLIEELLDLEPGTLSRCLGWVPVGTSVDNTEAAILTDESISGEHRHALVTMLRTFRQGQAGRQH